MSVLSAGIDLPFMMMPHPLLPVSLPPASVAMAMNQMNHLNTIANMAAAAQMHSPLSRAGASVIKVRKAPWGWQRIAGTLPGRRRMEQGAHTAPAPFGCSQH